MSIENEFNTLKDFIISVLEKHPETRNSDTALYVECCKELGAKTLDDINRLNLNIVSVHKTRQLVQNRLGLYPADDTVKESRNKRKWDIKEYIGKIAN